MKTEAEVIAHNLSLPGEGIRVGLQTTCIAKCRTGKHVLKTGLGAMGVGQMWVDTSDAIRADPDFEKLPVQSCVGGFGLHFVGINAHAWCKS